ncbi:hypothetical protein RB598_003734, partial [Gaeumannomyces tritici]
TAHNEVHVPCVLWGHYSLIVHGIPSIVSSVDFVISDADLVCGSQALSNAKHLTPCPDPSSCTTSSPSRPSLPPVFHRHIDASELTVGIYLQSETLWFLPPFTSDLLDPTGPQLPSQFTFASDGTALPPWRPGRGQGVFKGDLYPVVVLRSHTLLEAFLRLYARDTGKEVGSFGMAMIAYVELYVDSDGFLESDKLPEPLRSFYAEIRSDSMAKSVRQWTQELKEALGCA